MRWFGTVYTPLMAVLGLLFIILSILGDLDEAGPQFKLIAGAILAAGAMISGAIRRKS